MTPLPSDCHNHPSDFGSSCTPHPFPSQPFDHTHPSPVLSSGSAILYNLAEGCLEGAAHGLVVAGNPVGGCIEGTAINAVIQVFQPGVAL